MVGPVHLAPHLAVGRQLDLPDALPAASDDRRGLLQRPAVQVPLPDHGDLSTVENLEADLDQLQHHQRPELRRRLDQVRVEDRTEGSEDHSSFGSATLTFSLVSSSGSGSV